MLPCKIYTEWLHNKCVLEVWYFFKSKHLSIKAILLADNAPTHPTGLKNANTIIKFVPLKVCCNYCIKLSWHHLIITTVGCFYNHFFKSTINQKVFKMLLCQLIWKSVLVFTSLKQNQLFNCWKILFKN